MNRRRMARRFFRTPRNARGSVLIFAVVLLLLLTGIGTAFILYVRLSAKASANALAASSTDAIVDSAESHAMKVIREMLRNYEAVSYDGIFEPPAPNGAPTNPANHAYLISDPAAPSVAPQRSAFRLFEAYPAEATVAATVANAEGHAWLFWHEDPLFCGTTSLESGALPPLRFTQATLAHGAYPNGQIKVHYTGGPEHAGLARRFTVFANLDDFYSGPLDKKRVSGTRGEYYVWIADLGGKLQALPQTWGLDPVTALTPDTADLVAKNILSVVNGYGTNPPSSGWGGDGASYLGLQLSSAQLDTLWNRSPAQPYASVPEIALELGLTPPVPGDPAQKKWDYLNTRYGLDRYFNVMSDTPLSVAEAAKLKVPTSVKGHPAALNINTASIETLAAALSQVPLKDDDTTDINKAWALAARIAAKRPFLSHMDFEDFLAAHLNADPEGPADSLNDASKPVGMIKAAIPKRVELTVTQFLDLDEYGIDPDKLIAQNPVFADCFKAAPMEKRFEWFRADDTLAPLAGALISPKAFNNLLNSISGKRRDGTYGWSYYSYDPSTSQAPYDTGTGVPKLEYNRLVTGTTSQHVIEAGNTADNTEAGELKAWSATNTSGYYEMAFDANDDTQLIAYEDTVPGMPGDLVAVVDGGAVLQTPPHPPETVNGMNIVAAVGTTVKTYVHGPLRAYRHDVDNTLYPTAGPTAAVTDGASTDGDVSWSPRFAYRSRFFMIYTLARSIRTIDSSGTPRYGSTRRSEILYDALKDAVLWRREPSTEKRSLGDPDP